MESEIKYLLEKSLLDVKYLIDKAAKNNLTNKQWFIDILDTLNELSVKY